MLDDGLAALEGGAAAYAEDRLEEARDLWESAYRNFLDDGDERAAARVGALLGELHSSTLGNAAAGRGWLERSRRLLEAHGPCVEWGYWELARPACDRPDIDDLAESAARALVIARTHGDPALEVRALADAGLAAVSNGRVNDGFRLLDEALAAITNGAVTDPFVVGTAFCSLLSSCDRAGDLARAEEWLRLIDDIVLGPSGGRPRVLQSHCRIAYGGVLAAAGRFQEAEEQINVALAPTSSRCVGHRLDALARLAELRVHQGRLDEAEQLVATIEDHVAAAPTLAAVHLRRGAPELAAAVARDALRRLAGDVLRGAPLAELLVEAELSTGDVAAARQAADLLAAMRNASDAPVVACRSDIVEARLALAEGHAADAVTAAQRAAGALRDGEAPLLAGSARVLLAEAHEANGERPAAVVAARAAHSLGKRLGCPPLCDRSAAMLRRLGAPVPRPDAAAVGDALGGLTTREREVLELVRTGRTNAEIAAALFLSAKTVEHHVGRVLTKLGVRSRTEAATLAAAAD